MAAALPIAALLQTDGDSPEEQLAEVVGEGLTLQDWLIAGGIVLGSVILARLLRRLAERVVAATDADETVGGFVGRFVRTLTVVIGVVVALSWLEVRITPLLGALGIGGLAIAFAAQTILENTFASVVLRTRRPFRRGDQINTNDVGGTVVDVNFRTVVIRTYEGERVSVPCSMVLNNPITNHTVNGTRRTTLDVGVAYGTDLAQARDVLLAAASGAEGVLATPEPEAWVYEFADSSINIALRFWHAPENAVVWRVRNGVALAVKASLDEAGITIPFPQRVVTLPDGLVAAGDLDQRAPADKDSSVDR